MRTLHCFVIMPSGKNPDMQLATDEKDGLCRIPSGCEPAAGKVTIINFEDVYQQIVGEAIKRVNATLKDQGLEIECTRGEDLAEGGNIVSQFLDRICRAEITITDVTGLNPNVLLEYGIRLSVRDSLNVLLGHRGVKLPIDIADQRCIEYTTGIRDVPVAVNKIVRTIEEAIPAVLREAPQSVENLFRRTVENATGRELERRLAQALAPAPSLTAELVNELQRRGPVPKLRDRCWSFLESFADTLLVDPLGRDRAIEVYRLLTTLDGFREKRRDAFYKLNEICAEDPNREAEALAYLEQAKALET